MMNTAIKNFNTQFGYTLPIHHKERLAKKPWAIVAGMGGSHLAADILKTWNPALPLFIHRDYGLPRVPEDVLKNGLIIASSYSGNTEEVLDTYDAAKKRGIALAALAVGGKLLERAKKDGVPYIEIPDTGIQPRSALGFSVKGLLALLGEDEAEGEVSRLATTLDPSTVEVDGKKLAQTLFGKVPVIYASEKNASIAYNWKIKFNETGKIPAFYNVFSELNHNEMTGFDVVEKTKPLSEKFHFLILSDPGDHPRIQKRMEVLTRQYRDRGLPVTELPLAGTDVFHSIFSSLLLADWAAYHSALLYGAEPEAVPMIEEFKKLVA